MEKYIDYIYYRTCKIYYKYDGSSGIHAMLIISLTEGILLLDFILFLLSSFFTSQQLHSAKTIEYIAVAVSIAPVAIYNYIHYLRPKNKFNDLNEIWKNDSNANRIIKGFVIFIVLVMPWAILFLLNFYFHKSQAVI